MTDAIDLTDPTAFVFFSPDTPRLSDTDLFGHVNNVAHAALHETARVRYVSSLLEHTGGSFRRIMLVRVELDFLRDLMWPSPVRMGARVVDVGRTSLRIGIGCFDADGCVATSSSVVVHLGEQGRPEPIAGPLRALLERERDAPAHVLPEPPGPQL